MPTHHTVNYVELSVADLKTSGDFYRQAFGWQLNDYGPSYAGFRDDTGTARYTASAAGTVNRGIISGRFFIAADAVH